MNANPTTSPRIPTSSAAIPTTRHRRPWSSRDDARLRFLWGGRVVAARAAHTADGRTVAGRRAA